MGIPPDRHPGTREEDEIYLVPDSDDVTAQNGYFKYKTSVGFRFYEEGVEKGLTGSGLSESEHSALRQLIHFIDDGPAEGFVSGAFKELLPEGNIFPTTITWYESSDKSQKIVERTITWSGARIVTDHWEMFDTDGTTLLAYVTDSYVYSGIMPYQVTRTIWEAS